MDKYVDVKVDCGSVVAWEIIFSLATIKIKHGNFHVFSMEEEDVFADYVVGPAGMSFKDIWARLGDEICFNNKDVAEIAFQRFQLTDWGFLEEGFQKQWTEERVTNWSLVMDAVTIVETIVKRMIVSANASVQADFVSATAEKLAERVYRLNRYAPMKNGHRYIVYPDDRGSYILQGHKEDPAFAVWNAFHSSHQLQDATGVTDIECWTENKVYLNSLEEAVKLALVAVKLYK